MNLEYNIVNYLKNKSVKCHLYKCILLIKKRRFIKYIDFYYLLIDDLTVLDFNI